MSCYRKLYSSCSGNNSSLLSSYKFSYPYISDPLPLNSKIYETSSSCCSKETDNVCSRTGVCGDKAQTVCTGSSSGGCGDSKNLLPILDPEFNLREVVKQLILLEDHLTQVLKRCLDCILKHFLAIEGFLEEAKTLDKQGTYNSMLTKNIHEIQRLYRIFFNQYSTISDEDCCSISQELRLMRKDIMSIVKDYSL